MVFIFVFSTSNYRLWNKKIFKNRVALKPKRFILAAKVANEELSGNCLPLLINNPFDVINDPADVNVSPAVGFNASLMPSILLPVAVMLTPCQSDDLSN